MRTTSNAMRIKRSQMRIIRCLIPINRKLPASYLQFDSDRKAGVLQQINLTAGKARSPDALLSTRMPAAGGPPPDYG
jgi:hypothetical protein